MLKRFWGSPFSVKNEISFNPFSVTMLLPFIVFSDLAKSTIYSYIYIYIYIYIYKRCQVKLATVDEGPNHPSKINKTCWVLLGEVRMSSKAKFSNGFVHMDKPELANKQKISIHQLSVCIVCHVDDSPRTIANRDGWCDRVQGIHAVNTPWWWWWQKHALYFLFFCF